MGEFTIYIKCGQAFFLNIFIEKYLLTIVVFFFIIHIVEKGDFLMGQNKKKRLYSLSPIFLIKELLYIFLQSMIS